MNLSKLAGSATSRKKMRVYVLNMETGKTSTIIVYHDIEAVMAVHNLKEPFKYLCIDSELYIERRTQPPAEGELA